MNSQTYERSIILPIKEDSQKAAWWKKGLASSWLWLFLAICFLPGVFKGKTEKSVVLGMLLFAVVAWIIGMLIPSFWWPWFHAAIFVMIQIAAVIGFSLKSKKKTTK